jgi:hypothetical protein
MTEQSFWEGPTELFLATPPIPNWMIGVQTVSFSVRNLKTLELRYLRRKQKCLERQLRLIRAAKARRQRACA